MKKTIVAAVLFGFASLQAHSATIGHFNTKDRCTMELTDTEVKGKSGVYYIAHKWCRGTPQRVLYSVDEENKAFLFYTDKSGQPSGYIYSRDVTAGAIPQYDPETMRDILQAELIGQSVARNLRRNSW